MTVLKGTSKELRTIILFCIVLLTIIIAIRLNASKEQYRKIVDDLKTQIEECGRSNVELQKLRDRLKGIKDDDDLLKRDIQLYIDTKYPMIPSVLSTEIADQVVNHSRTQDVSPELIVGIMQVESNFNPMAISKKNARGLMQIMPVWAKKFGIAKVCDLHNISTNIETGIKVLKIHIEENDGSLNKGLYHYVNRADGYADKVYNAMGRFMAFRSTVDMPKTDEGEVEIEMEVKTVGNDNTNKTTETIIDEPPEQIK
jgi:hypothetical protein